MAVYVVAALPFGISRRVGPVVPYHQDARRAHTHSGAARKILDTLWDRDLLVVLALVARRDRVPGARSCCAGSRASAG